MAPENGFQTEQPRSSSWDASERMQAYDGRFLGLTQDPFAEHADPVFFFTGTDRRALYHSLLDRLFLAGGLFLLTGGKGSGKTLLSARLAHELRARGAFVVTASAADATPPLSTLSQALGVPEPGDDIMGWAAAIRRAAAMHEEAERSVVFFVDDAQALGRAEIAALEQLLGRSEPLRLVLVGRPEIGDDLAPALQADLARALRLHCALGRMSGEEIGSLVWHRLRRAGCRRAELFSDDAMDVVVAHAGGVPGRAVRLCAATLRRAVAQSSTEITGALVREAARALPPDLEDRTAHPAGARWYEPRRYSAAAPPRRRGFTTKLAIAVGCLVGVTVATAGFVLVATPESVRSATLLQGFSSTAPKPASVATVVVAVEPKRRVDDDRSAAVRAGPIPVAALARPAAPPSGPSALETRQVAQAAPAAGEAQGSEGTSTAPAPSAPPPVSPAEPAAPSMAAEPERAADVPSSPSPAAEPASAETATPAEAAPSPATSEAQQPTEAPAAPQPAAESAPAETAAPVEAGRSAPTGEAQQPTETSAASNAAPEPPSLETAAPVPVEPPSPTSKMLQATEAPTAPAPQSPTPSEAAPVSQPTIATEAAPPGNATPSLSGTTDLAQPSSGESSAGSAFDTGDPRVEMVRLLMARGARQVSAGQITAPSDDNALTTYREILLIAPEGNAGPELLESIRAHYREKARSAETAGNSAEAHRLEALALDPLRAAETDAGSSEQASGPASPATTSEERTDATATAQPSPAPSAGANAQDASPAPSAPPPPAHTDAAAAAAPSSASSVNPTEGGSPAQPEPAPAGRADAAAAAVPPAVPSTAPTEQAATAALPSPSADGRANVAPPPATSPPPAPSTGATQPPTTRATTKLSQEMIDALMKRGEAMLAVGDISAARLLYERAAEAGNAKAATAVGKTYDPAFLRQIAARGVAPQPERAAEWYRRALEAGDAEAGARLSALGESRR